MTRRERVLAALRRQEPDRIPFELGGFNREGQRRFREATGSDDANAYFGVEPTYAQVFPSDLDFDLAARFLPWHDLDPGDYRVRLPARPVPGTFTLNEWGSAFVVGSDVAYDRFVAPAAVERAGSAAEVAGFPRADFDRDERYDGLDERVRSLRENDLVVMGAATCTLFERAWQIRGFERFLTDLVEDADIAELLLDRELENALARVRRFAAAGVDVIYLGDDVAMQDRLILSPVAWRRFFKGRMAAIVEAARAAKPDVLVKYHSDGDISPLIPDLIDVGVDILNPLQPECMDLVALRREYGSHLAFWGTLGIQHTLPFGSPADVEAEVRERIDTLGPAGLYLAPTHAIAPEVPHANLAALVRAAQRYG